MACFLVDYENVTGNGLRGFQFLTGKDRIILYYSDLCTTVKNQFIHHLNMVGTEIDLVKLIQARKNALDFYIASDVGRLIAEGERQIAIISTDKGYNSVIEYVKTQEKVSARVVLAPTIENGIISLDAAEDKNRRAYVLEQIRTVNLETEYARIQERRAFKQQIREAFVGTTLEKETEKIISFIDSTRQLSPKNRYLQSLHTFGRQNGLEIYNVLKKEI